MKVLIIGCGNIAAFYDNPSSLQVLTHAHGFKKCTQVKEIGFYDINYNQAEKAANVWGGVAFRSIEEALNDYAPSVVSICTTTCSHYEILIQVAKHNPKFVICEKPLTLSAQESESIVTLYEKKNIKLIVNYSRRFTESFRQIKASIDNLEFGQVITAVAIYTKGIRNGGAHALNLAQFLFGPHQKQQVLSSKIDNDQNDPSLDAFISFEKCPSYHLMAANERSFSLFELDIIFERARFRFVDSGFELQRQDLIQDELYTGYKKLGDIKFSKTDLINSVNNLISSVTSDNSKYVEVSSGREAAMTDRLINALMK
jgi:predicted dehydrogenase